MTRKEILMKELESGEYDAVYQLISRATSDYCKCNCEDIWEDDRDLCIKPMEIYCIKAWLESEVPENQKFLSE